MKFNMNLEFTIDTANVFFIRKIQIKLGSETFMAMNFMRK